MRSLGILLLIALVPTSAAQGDQSFYMLHMQDYNYLPPTLEVPAGVEVLAMNFGPSNQSIPRDQWGEFYHTVTASADRSLFDVQKIPPDGTAHPFRAPSTPGTYPFYCVYHGDKDGNGMAGVLIVNASAAPPSASPAPSPSPSPSPTPAAAWIAIAAGVAGAALLRSRRTPR